MTIPSPKPWRPRSSSLGGYFACDQRAALDRAIHEGLMPPVPQEPAPFADLGTIIHHRLQTTMGCVFPAGPAEPPKPEMYECAASLFKDDRALLDAAVERATGTAFKGMPPTPDGKPWMAETDVAAPHTDITGHIDFLSQDLTVIGDLKTTARKPDHNRIKPAHMYQLAAYAILVEDVLHGRPEKAFVLYVDSLKGAWYMRIWIDLTTPDFRDFMEQVRKYARSLRSPDLFDRAIPRLGQGCSSNFCPYVGICRDKLIPPAGTPEDVSIPTLKPKAFLS